MRPPKNPIHQIDSRTAWTLFTVACITLAVFLPATGNSLVNWDDEQNFLRNAGLQVGWWDHFYWAWRSPLLGVYQPLAWHLLYIQRALGGDSGGLIHFVSAALHAGIAAAAVAFASRFAQKPIALWAGLGALVFSLHPLRVEVVAWASCQPYLWSTLFALLSVWFYWNTLEDGATHRTRDYRRSVFFFLLAFLCKPIVFSLPAVFLLMRRWYLPTEERRDAILHDGMFWGITLVFLLLAFRARTLMPELRLDQIPKFPLWLLPAGVLGHSLLASLIPLELSPLYPLSQSSVGWAVGGSLVGVAAAAMAWRRRGWGFLLALLGVLLAPGVASAFTERVAFADRVTYLPALAVAITLPAFFASAWASYSTLVLSAASAVLVGLGIQTLGQISVWRNSEALWKHAMNCGAESGKAFSNLGTAYLEGQKLQDAESAFKAALRLDVELPEAHNGFALCLISKGEWKAAEQELKYALGFKPHYPEAVSNLAYVTTTLGKHAEALELVNKAIAWEPFASKMRENRGRILQKLGRSAEAVEDYRWVAASNPRDAQSWAILGAALMEAGRGKEALEPLGNALLLAPGDLKAQYNFAVALQEAGRLQEARELTAKLLNTAPDFGPAQSLMRELTRDSQAVK